MNTDNNKPQWGGYREGSGRKPGAKKFQLTGYLTEPTYNKFIEAAGLRKSELLETIVSDYFSPTGSRLTLDQIKSVIAQNTSPTPSHP